MPPQQPGSYQGGEMMMMKSVIWWRKPEYPEETTDLKKATPRLVRNPQFIDPGVYILPRGDGAHLPDPPELLAASSAPSNDPASTPAPSDDPASTPAPSDDPAATQAPSDDPAATQAPSDDSATMPAPTGDFPVTAISLQRRPSDSSSALGSR